MAGVGLPGVARCSHRGPPPIHGVRAGGPPGAARALLWVLWAGGARLLASAAGTGDARAPGLVLAVGAGVLWIATLRDTAALAGSARTSGAPVDPRPWLGGRALAILVAVVTGGLLLSLVLATAG